MRLEFTVTGAPRTKKNHGVMVLRGKPRLFPPKPWREWARDAQIIHPVLGTGGFIEAETVRYQVNCRALFYCDTARSVDAVGLYQGLADLLEKREVVENDRLIASWDGSRVLIDRENPRTEVTLESIG